MTRRSWPVAAFVALASSALTWPALAAPQGISVHSGWGAFREDQKCYAIAMAEPSRYARERQPFASVNASSGQLRFTMRLSRTLTRDGIVTLDVGNRRFRLRGAGDSAWAVDAKGNAAIIAAIRTQDTMTVGARDAQGRFFRDAYKLKGAPTAIDSAIVACR